MSITSLVYIGPTTCEQAYGVVRIPRGWRAGQVWCVWCDVREERWVRLAHGNDGLDELDGLVADETGGVLRGACARFDRAAVCRPLLLVEGGVAHGEVRVPPL